MYSPHHFPRQVTPRSEIHLEKRTKNTREEVVIKIWEVAAPARRVLGHDQWGCEEIGEAGVRLGAKLLPVVLNWPRSSVFQW